MGLNIDIEMQNIFADISNIITTATPDVKECVKQALEAQKTALEYIGKARINKEITTDEMKSHLKDEQMALEAALLACQVEGKVMANEVSSSVMTLFRDVIIKLIRNS